MRGSRGGDGFVDVGAQSLEDARGFGTQVFGAGFVAWELCAVEEQHLRAGARKQQRRRRTGGAGTDNHRIPSSHAMSPAQTAPVSVAARFTASLSIQRILPCTVAPRRESTSM